MIIVVFLFSAANKRYAGNSLSNDYNSTKQSYTCFVLFLFSIGLKERLVITEYYLKGGE